jgi:hypothetical protein
MSYGVSNSSIAEHIGISRQMVTKHRRRGMPNDSLGAASAWYFANVSTCRRKRGTYSNLPMRLPAYRFDDDDATAAAIASLSGVHEVVEDEPKPVKLDNFPSDFWGESATASIIRILGKGKAAPFKKRENILAAWFCISSAQRCHLKLMPQMLAPLLVGLDSVEEIEAQLMEWAIAFAEHWHGKEYYAEPILPTNIEKLSDFYRPLEK